MTHSTHTSRAHPHGTTESYVVGFVASLVLTIIPYLVVIHGYLVGPQLVGVVVFFAIAQFVIQMICFLHLNPRKDGRWNLVTFGIIFIIVFILVIGTLWVMNHLAANMAPDQIAEYLHKQN